MISPHLLANSFRRETCLANKSGVACAGEPLLERLPGKALSCPSALELENSRSGRFYSARAITLNDHPVPEVTPRLIQQVPLRRGDVKCEFPPVFNFQAAIDGGHLVRRVPANTGGGHPRTWPPLFSRIRCGAAASDRGSDGRAAPRFGRPSEFVDVREKRSTRTFFVRAERDRRRHLAGAGRTGIGETARRFAELPSGGGVGAIDSPELGRLPRSGSRNAKRGDNYRGGGKTPVATETGTDADSASPSRTHVAVLQSRHHSLPGRFREFFCEPEIGRGCSFFSFFLMVDVNVREPVSWDSSRP